MDVGCKLRANSKGIQVYRVCDIAHHNLEAMPLISRTNIPVDCPIVGGKNWVCVKRINACLQRIVIVDDWLRVEILKHVKALDRELAVVSRLDCN